MDESARQRLEFLLGINAKLLCSGVFVAGREPDEFIRNDLLSDSWPEPFGFDAAEVTVDRQRQTVTLAADGLARTAVYHDGLGCTLLPPGERRVCFEPVRVSSSLPDPATQPWPMGDLLSDEPMPPEVDEPALATALDLAFDDTAWPSPPKTRALVVVYKGRIIAERYAPGFTRDTRHVSWSAGKSITAALTGILVKDGHFGLDDYAPIAEWQGLDDRRRVIRVRNLLQMSSGLLFRRAGAGDPLEISLTPLDNHTYVYFGAIDVFQHAVSAPPEFPPNTVWRYRNCDTLSLGAIIRRTVEGRGEEYLSFPQRALFDRIGIRRMVLEPDAYGNFVMTGINYGTARDWARFGLLHLWDGVWQGERILPAGWVDFVRTPAPAHPSAGYGGQFWLNAGGRYPHVPRDAFWAEGAMGQWSLVLPSHDMVIVRLGHSLPTDDTFRDRVVHDIVASVRRTS